MSADQFWDSTLKEVLLAVKGFNRRENEAWQRTRLQSYIVYCSVTDQNKRVPIYKFLELDGDPTPEEIAEREQEEIQQQMDDAVARYESMKDNL